MDATIRKLATIVALDVAGYSARTEADEARTTAEVAALGKLIDSIATRHGGRIFNTAGDGFMLDFGSSLAAVEASFELAERCEPKVRIGVHLGDVVVQPNGDLLGHGVNVAARLMALSDPGSTLISSAVRQTIRGPVLERLISRGMLRMDKMNETIEAFAMVAAPSVTVAPPAPVVALPQPEQPPQGELAACIGRAREFALVRDRVDKAKRREGMLLLFSGEAGVGKTRLTQEAERIARLGGFVVTRGHCLDTDSAPPYQALLEQIEQTRRLLGSDIMRRSMGENAAELAKLMPELRHQYSDIPAYPSLPPDQERRYLLHGVAEFLARSAAVRPLMMVFEDLHWADESTCTLLCYLAERLKGEPVLLVGTYREGELAPSGPFGRALQKITRDGVAEDIRLGRLSPAELAELLVNKFDMAPPPALVDLIFSETEGNPFFIEQVIGLLQDSGKLLTVDGKFQTNIEIADTEVARGVRLIIEDRIGRTSALCREVLTLAAVVGRFFAFDLLVEAQAKHDEDELLSAIEEAESKRLIEDVSRGRIARYQFVHEQTRQTLLSGLSRPRRQRLHLRIADAIESSQAGAVEKNASEIGHHLYQAGSAADHSRTAQHLSIAGKRAIDALAFEDALRLLDLADSVLEDEGEPLQRAKLQGLRAIALQGGDRVPDSLAALKIAVALAPTPPTKDEFMLQRCSMLLQIWRASEAIDDLELLLTRAQATGDPLRELDVQRAVARAYYVMSLDHKGFADKSRSAYESVIALARAQGVHKTLGESLVATATLVDYWPDYRPQALANLDEAEKIARVHDDEAIAIDVATARLSLTSQTGGITQDEQVLKRALAHRDPVRLNALYFRMMWSTFRQARLERCVEICDAGIELAYRIGTLPVMYPTIKALALIEGGRFDQAWDSLGQEIADDAHRFGAAVRDFGKLRYEISVGDFEAALGRAPHVISEAKVLMRAWMLSSISGWIALVAPLFADDPAMLDRIDALVAETGSSPGTNGKAALALARGDLVTARQTLDAASASNAATAAIAAIAAKLTHFQLLASVDSAQGHWPAAHANVTRAVTLAREMGMASSLWRLLGEQSLIELGLGQAYDAEASKAQAHSVLAEICLNLTNQRQRACLGEGLWARQLGLVDRAGVGGRGDTAAASV